MFEIVTVIGAGSGGKAAAADLALQGKRVRLFEFPEFWANAAPLAASRRLTAAGAVTGTAVLDLVTDDLARAVSGADTIMVCTQALAHERVARELAGVVRPDTLVILNPGSTGGACLLAHVFRQSGLKELPTLVEFSTLTYGCRAQETRVEIAVKVNRVLFGVLPAQDAPALAPPLTAAYPGLVPAESVLEAGLNNANPVIHPPITLLNAARFENEGAKVRFYADGVSPTVAKLIQALDQERMALLRALGYAAQPDPVTCVEQGYAASTDYFECYAKGPVFSEFTAPNTLDHRYLHEDIGMGLVMFCSLGELLNVPTPASRAMVHLGSLISGIDYFAQGARTLQSLGLDGLTVEELKGYLVGGRMPPSRPPLTVG
jgi:opine dehydrogenase